MNPSPLTPTTRLLLFPQVGPSEGATGRPAVRRYSLSLLPVARRAERGGRVGGGKPAR